MYKVCYNWTYNWTYVTIEILILKMLPPMLAKSSRVRRDLILQQGHELLPCLRRVEVVFLVQSSRISTDMLGEAHVADRVRVTRPVVLHALPPIPRV